MALPLLLLSLTPLAISRLTPALVQQQQLVYISQHPQPFNPPAIKEVHRTEAAPVLSFVGTRDVCMLSEHMRHGCRQTSRLTAQCTLQPLKGHCILPLSAEMARAAGNRQTWSGKIMSFKSSFEKCQRPGQSAVLWLSILLSTVRSGCNIEDNLVLNLRRKPGLGAKLTASCQEACCAVTQCSRLHSCAQCTLTTQQLQN